MRREEGGGRREKGRRKEGRRKVGGCGDDQRKLWTAFYTVASFFSEV
jgi:hypothetical protein